VTEKKVQLVDEYEVFQSVSKVNEMGRNETENASDFKMKGVILMVQEVWKNHR